MRKFLLIALPATGKTTTLQACVSFLKIRGVSANFINTDILINTRISSTDPVIQQYENEHHLKIPSVVFESADRCKAFMALYGEPALRDLEERLLVDIIYSSKEDDWLDLGGRAFLLPAVISATEKMKIIPVFLYANHETIIPRLEKDDDWRQRPSYTLAAERSADGQGTPAEIIQEIFLRIKELELVVSKNTSQFSRK